MRRLIGVIGTILLLFVLAQSIPSGLPHQPISPITGTMDSLGMDQQVKLLFIKACADCHSPSTGNSWFTHIQPASAWLGSQSIKGRRNFDIALIHTYSKRKLENKFHSIADVMEDGSMPPRVYTSVNPAARLTQKEKDLIETWAEAAAARTAGQ
jgi:hypothetical protein